MLGACEKERVPHRQLGWNRLWRKARLSLDHCGKNEKKKTKQNLELKQICKKSVRRGHSTPLHLETGFHSSSFAIQLITTGHSLYH